MSGGQFKCPIVIRGAGGAAHQLAAQHSNSFEAMYCNTPGLKVVMPATPADAKGLLKSAIRDDDPVIFIEGELLYGEQGEVPEGEHLVPIGKGDIKRAGTDCTIVAYSKMVGLAQEAAKDAQALSQQAQDLTSEVIKDPKLATALTDCTKELANVGQG